MSHALVRRRAARFITAAIAALAFGGSGLLAASPASAATRTVCAVGCDFTSIQAAVTAASAGDTVTIAAGTYNENAIVVSKPLSIVGAGRGQTIIDGGGGNSASNNRIFSITPLEAVNGTGAISISGLTVQNTPVASAGYAIFVKVNRPTTGITGISFDDVEVIGRGLANEFGMEIASGITAGVVRQTPPVTIIDSKVSGQGANGILFDDWRAPVTVTGSDLSAGTLGTASALFGLSELTATPRITDAYSITGNTFHGSAVGFQTYFSDSGGFDSVTVVGNTMTELKGSDSGVFLAAGTAAVTAFGTVAVTGNTMTGNGDIAANTNGVRLSGLTGSLGVTENSLAGLAHGVRVLGSVPATASVQVNANRLFGDVSGVDNASAAAVDATGNWWGCNAGPTAGSSDCSPASATGAGSVDTTTWIVVTASAADATVQVNATTALVTDLTHLNDGTTVALPAVFNGLGVTRSADQGTVEPTAGTLSNGIASPASYTAPDSAVCPATVQVVVDSQVFAVRTVTGGGVAVEICVEASSPTTSPAPTVSTSTGTSLQPVSTVATSTPGGLSSTAALAKTGTSATSATVLGLLLAVAGGGLIALAHRRGAPRRVVDGRHR